MYFISSLYSIGHGNGKLVVLLKVFMYCSVTNYYKRNLYSLIFLYWLCYKIGMKYVISLINYAQARIYKDEGNKIFFYQISSYNNNYFQDKKNVNSICL